MGKIRKNDKNEKNFFFQFNETLNMELNFEGGLFPECVYQILAQSVC